MPSEFVSSRRVQINRQNSRTRSSLDDIGDNHNSTSSISMAASTGISSTAPSSGAQMNLYGRQDQHHGYRHHPSVRGSRLAASPSSSSSTGGAAHIGMDGELPFLLRKGHPVSKALRQQVIAKQADRKANNCRVTGLQFSTEIHPFSQGKVGNGFGSEEIFEEEEEDLMMIDGESEVPSMVVNNEQNLRTRRTSFTGGVVPVKYPEGSVRNINEFKRTKKGGDNIGKTSTGLKFGNSANFHLGGGSSGTRLSAMWKAPTKPSKEFKPCLTSICEEE
eukprot:Nk52_evm14s490 gene=Nk52_evmTU14s490